MQLIRFKTAKHLIFIKNGELGVEYKDFAAGDLVEFDVTLTEKTANICMLRCANGSFAPGVYGDDFEILPEGFKLFRFTRTVNLSSAKGYSPDSSSWQWGETQCYIENSVQAFKIVEGDFDPNKYYGYLTLRTLDGKVIPGIPSSLLKLVNPTKPVSSTKAKRILETFPEPVPGVIGFGDCDWNIPYTFNSLNVVRDRDVPNKLVSVETPVAYLRLVQGDGDRHPKFYYLCTYFGAKRKLAKA